MRKGARCLFFLTGVVLLGCATSPDVREVRIVPPYGSLVDGEGYPRSDGPHEGVDIAGPIGTPVIAAGAGVVTATGYFEVCGNFVTIWHREFDEYTRYCHLSPSYEVKPDQWVSRGDVIGYIGNTGRTGGIMHVHFTFLSAGKTKDPLTIMAGCFDPKKTYPTDRLVLSYPVRCGPSSRIP
jgi:murein DD-endopeptidase MepM/ murein hydrolase activator NlpD